jgi:hemerythrin
MMEKFEWSPEMAFGIPAIDDAHQEFVNELDALLHMPDSQFPVGLFALIKAMERDFRAEEDLMEKIDFPEICAHREQHARVLASLHEVVATVMLGEVKAAREVVEILPHWFMFHLTTMDMTLAVALDLTDDQSYMPMVQHFARQIYMAGVIEKE